MLCFRCGSHNPDGSEFCSQCGQKFVDRKKPPKDPTNPEMGSVSSVELKTLDVGTQIAERYEVRSVIGIGPVGVVYRTHDLEIDVDVAVKIMSPKLLQSKDERKRFLAEIRNARKIKHGNVVRLYDEDQVEDQVFFTMQMLEGLNLRKIIELRKDKGQEFSLKEIEPIFSHVCQALDQAHESMAHGNLKPENILVLPDMLKVTDFGIISALPHRPFVAAQKSSAAGMAYLAPEVREDEPTLEPAADIYSLGVILCEMVSNEIYQGPSSSLPNLPKEFEKLTPVIKRALNENPAKRQRSPRDFFDDLHTACSGPKAKSANLSKPPRPAPKRKSSESKEKPSVAESKPADKQQRPPRAAPSRRKMSFGVGDAVDPPTVVDATVQADDPPIKQGKLAKSSDEDEAIGELAAAVEPDEILPEEIEEIDEVEDIDEVEEIDGDEFETIEEEDLADLDDVDESMDSEPEDDQETLVATPLTPVGSDKDLRVAKPVNESQPPAEADDVASRLEDKPEQVEVLTARKRQDTMPVQQSAGGPVDQTPAPVVEVSQPPLALPVVQAGQPAVSMPPGVSQPPYPYSQPPYGYSQPPPPPSRLPAYVFLSIITAFVGIAVYFLVDYLIAAKKQLTDGTTVASVVEPVKPADPVKLDEGDKALIAAADANPTKPDLPTPAADVAKVDGATLAEEEAKLAEQRRKVDEYLKAEEVRIAEERRKLEEARKSDAAKVAGMIPAPRESKRDFETRRAVEKRKAAEKRKAEDKRLAEKRRKAEERRLAEEQRLAEQRRKADERRKADKQKKSSEARRSEVARKAAETDMADKLRKAEEVRLAAERKKADHNKPMLEEVPIPGDPAPDKKPAPKPKEVAKVIEAPKDPDPVPAPAQGGCPRGMVFVSQGTAYIGSATNDPMRNFGEMKLHKVEMKGYCIDRYEYPNAPGSKPKSSVSWNVASKLCKKRGKRLCNEEEWEYACKGKSNRSFPYGKTWDPNRCNTDDSEGNDRQITTAGAFKGCRSPFGLMDMSGNVSEWTASKYQPGAAARTYKGGSAMRPNWATRCATRSSMSPGANKVDLGFRCCANSK